MALVWWITPYQVEGYTSKSIGTAQIFHFGFKIKGHVGESEGKGGGSWRKSYRKGRIHCIKQNMKFSMN